MGIAAPRVSVIMATYNWSSVLPYSIASVLRQTLADFELLVVGDGCTDDSADVVRGIGDERVHWIGLDQNSGHQSGPNNEGLRRARGDIVAYLGHDDLWFPEHLASLVTAIDAGADLASSATRWVSPDPGDDPITLLPTYFPGAYIPPSSVAHRRAVTETVGGWNDYRRLTEAAEEDLWRRAHAAGFRFAFVPRLTVVKFPASLRRNVYRERPHHEQASWLKRIEAESDLAEVELMGVVAEYMPNRNFYRHLVSHFWRATWRRVRRRLNARDPAGMAPGAATDARKKFKGVEPHQVCPVE
jgi:glycosyltransferase involved in cell wall biosynthesis